MGLFSSLFGSNKSSRSSTTTKSTGNSIGIDADTATTATASAEEGDVIQNINTLDGGAIEGGLGIAEQGIAFAENALDSVGEVAASAIRGANDATKIAGEQSENINKALLKFADESDNPAGESNTRLLIIGGAILAITFLVTRR